MSNKRFDKLMPLDREVRRLHRVGMNDGVHATITIELYSGFELFNDRPYHNYETWSDGYRVVYQDEDGRRLEIHEEDLDDALNALATKLRIGWPQDLRPGAEDKP